MTDTTSTQEIVIYTNKTTSWENWCQETARYLNKNRLAHAMFGWGDSFNLAISLPKLVFDEEHFHTNVSSAAELNAWLLSPLGLSLSVGLCLFSILGNYIDSDQCSSFWVFFADLWPYVRDILKAYKWIAKAVCNLLLLEMSLCSNDVASLVIPYSLFFGTIAAIERVWYRSMKEERMQMEKSNLDAAKKIYTAGLCFYEYDKNAFDVNKSRFNTFVLVKDPDHLDNSKLFYYDNNGSKTEYTDLVHMENFCRDINEKNKEHKSVMSNSIFYKHLLQILASNVKSQDDINSIQRLQCGTDYNYWKSQSTTIKTQNTALRAKCFFAKGLESLFNGLYFYSGAMIMTAFSPQTFLIMSAISLGFLFSSFITKLYEEYSYQKKLDLTSHRLNLALSERKLHALFEDLVYYDQIKNNDQINNCTKNLNAIYAEYEKHLINVQKGLSWTYTESFFEGLQNGLSLQSAITSLMFCLFLLNIVSVTAPTVFYFTLVGAASVLTHCIYSLYQCYIYRQESVEQMSQTTNRRISQLKQKILNQDSVQTHVYDLQTELKNSYDLLVSPRRFSIVEFEIFRVCFAGFKKGTKAGDEIDDLLSCFNDQSFEHWSYFGKISLTLLFAVSFAARTLAKNCAPSGPSSAVKTIDSSQELSAQGGNSPHSKHTVATLFNNPTVERTVCSTEFNYLQLTA